MPKLESLSDFNKKEINRTSLSKFVGGVAAGPTQTASGTLCVSTVRSASGCMAYSSDVVYEDGSTEYTPKNCTNANSDVNLPPC